MNKVDFIKIKIFFLLEDTIKKMKNQVTDLKSLSVIYIKKNTELISKILKELLQLSNLKDNPVKIGQKTILEWTIFKRYTNDQ